MVTVTHLLSLVYVVANGEGVGEGGVRGEVTPQFVPSHVPRTGSPRVIDFVTSSLSDVSQDVSLSHKHLYHSVEVALTHCVGGGGTVETGGANQNDFMPTAFKTSVT